MVPCHCRYLNNYFQLILINFYTEYILVNTHHSCWAMTVWMRAIRRAGQVNVFLNFYQDALTVNKIKFKIKSQFNFRVTRFSQKLVYKFQNILIIKKSSFSNIYFIFAISKKKKKYRVYTVFHCEFSVQQINIYLFYKK